MPTSLPEAATPAAGNGDGAMGDERTQDQTGAKEQRCANCRFWSEIIARAYGDSPVYALCLAAGGPNQGNYVRERDTCSAWKSGHFGAIDSPPEYGKNARAAYKAEAGQ